MWIVRNREGEIAGAHGTLQLDAEGKPRLMPVGDGPDAYLAEQEWVEDAVYWEWKKNRPKPAPGKSLEQRVAELEVKLAERVK